MNSQRQIISFRAAAALAVGILLVQLAMTGLLAGNPALRGLLSNVITPLAGGLATAGLLYAAFASEKGSRIRMAWIILAMAELCYTAGDLIWSVLESLFAQQPFPSKADIFYLAFYILFPIGVLLLPAVPLTRGERLKMLLDMGIVMISALLGFWVFLLQPIVITGEQDTLTLALSLAYPVMDLVLLYALLQLMFRRFGFSWAGPPLLLAAGAAVKIMADVIYSIPSFQRTYVSGDLLDAGWILSILLFGLAGVFHAAKVQSDSPSSNIRSPNIQLTWPRYLPYFAAGSAYILLIWSRDHLVSEFSLILWGVGGILGLLIVRQVVALNENSRLYSFAQREIEERKKSGEMLRETRDYLESLIDYASAPIIVWDPSFRITRFNHAFERLTDLEDGEVLGQPLDLLFPEKSSEESMAYIRRTLSGERWEAVEIPIRRRDGSVKTVLWNSSNIHDKTGKVVATIAQGQDITERKLAEEELQKSEARCRAIVEDQTELISRSLPSGVLTFVNDAFCRYFGKKREELIGRSFFPIIPDEDYEIVKMKLASLSKEMPVATYEHRAMVKGEVHWTEWTDRMVFDKSGSLVEIQSVGRDITENKRAEEEIRRLNEDLERRVLERTEELKVANEDLKKEIVERKRAESEAKASLVEKEMLLREVHHRVKNNLQVISSLLSLQSEHIKDKKALEMFRESQNRVVSMAKIHEKLYKSGDLTRIDFAEYIRSLACDLLRSYGSDPKRIKLKINVHDVLMSIDTAISCGLIINELVSNSLKHAFPEGREGEIHVYLLSDDGSDFALIVSDNGIGLPEDIDLRSTESLGLLLVSTLTNQLKGTIEVDRSSGTEFRIKFSGNKTERER